MAQLRSRRGFGDTWVEGRNHRVGACPADYTYNKTLKLAYIATGDRRFVDYFEEAGTNAVNRFGEPPPLNPDQFLEMALFRLAEQRLENIANAAEFAHDTAVSTHLRTVLRENVDLMLARVLIDGHRCSPSGTGSNDVRQLGRCDSAHAWMMPTAIDWAVRTSRLLGHGGLAAWVVAHGQRAAQHHTVLDANGLPDISQRDSSSAANARNGWRTIYGCNASAAGVDNGSCTKLTDPSFENSGYFYPDGLVAFLNVFGLVLASDQRDMNRICQWLPAAYTTAYP